MRTKIGQWVIALSLILAIGGHWAVLQSVAWVGMVVSYSRDAPLPVALEKTFSGKHPCNLCKFVQEGKQSEKEQDFVKVKTKLDFWLVQTAPLLFPPPPFVLPGGPDSPRLRAESPPTPPPRLA